MTNKTILITGCSTGIGRTTAKYFQERGWNVVATVRSNPEADKELKSLDNAWSPSSTSRRKTPSTLPSLRHC